MCIYFANQMPVSVHKRHQSRNRKYTNQSICCYCQQKCIVAYLQQYYSVFCNEWLIDWLIGV